jgi:membrane-bound lytic murein transglycosylase F
MHDRVPAAMHASRSRKATTAGARLFLALSALALGACSNDRLQTVKTAGEITVLTHVSPTTYYENPEGPAGFEYDLSRAFADYLGVKLRLVVANDFSDVLPRLMKGDADFAAAGVTVTESRRAFVRFTPPYQQVRQQVIFRRGSARPTTMGDLTGREIEVHAGTSYAERLRELKSLDPDLKWTESSEKPTEELLELVWEGLLDITIADSNIVDVNRQYFPEIQVAFDFQKPEGLAWAFPLGDDDSLYEAAAQFLAAQRKSGELARLIERYYGPASRSNYVNMTIYQLRVRNRLPTFQTLFEKAGRRHRIDWRLLAALGYQESYWDPRAISPTGVRGIMMLTEETARHMSVRNRLDAAQSIDGGARYFARMFKRIPYTVTGPDRMWMALAAYNIGISHLEDARVLTQKQGADPNKWNDVKERLPLLEQEKWAARTRNGIARGREAVLYVNRVRVYYDVLVRHDETERAQNRSDALTLKAPAL